MDTAEDIIRTAEGCFRKPARDTRGILTAMIGCVVDPAVKDAPGFCDAAIEAQFAHDSAQARARAAALPNFATFNDVQQGVLVSICFQLGAMSNAEWPDFNAALAAGNLDSAANALLTNSTGGPSLWKLQTPVRAGWETGMLRTGVLEPYPI